jgi:hypothetical protein
MMINTNQNSIPFNTALVLGKPESFVLAIGKYLASKNLIVHQYTDSPALGVNGYNQIPVITRLNNQLPFNYRYVFITKPTKKTLSKLNQQNLSQSKLVFITTHDSLNPKNLSPQRLLALLQQFPNLLASNYRIVNLNHVYGESVEGFGLSSLYPTRQTLTLPFTETSIIYPLYQADAINGICKSIFNNFTKNQIFELAGIPTSLINATLQFRLISTFSVAVKFTNNTTLQAIPPNVLAITHKSLNWQPHTSLTKGLSTLPKVSTPISPPPIAYQSPTPKPTPTSFPIKTFIIDKPQVPPLKPVKETFTTSRQETFTPITKPNKKFFLTKPTLSFPHRPIWIAILAIVLTPTIFCLIFIYHFLAFKSSLLTALSSFKTGSFANFDQAANSAKYHLNTLAANYQTTKPIFAFILGPNNTTNLSSLLKIGQYTTSTLSLTQDALIKAKLALPAITNKTSDDPLPIINDIDTDLVAAFQQLSSIIASVNSSANNNSFTNPKRIMAPYLPEIDSLRAYLQTSHQLLSLSRNLLGFDKAKTYLLLFQNNTELRATGGFIGSYGLVTFERGKLVNLKVEDVYTADGQLKGHVEPPAEIKDFLDEAGWHLRDVNWDPDFPTTAAQAAWFLDKEIDQKVDGVIALNLYVIKELLSLTGPVKVLDYDETISTTNLFDTVQSHVERNQFPGSTQKTNFLSKLSTSLLDHLLRNNQINLIDLAKFYQNSVRSNHLFISVFNPEAQSLLDVLGVTGKIQKPTCPETSPTCTNDYLYLVESNFGVNKVNYYVTRSIKHQLDLSRVGETGASTTITYANLSTAETWMGGTYKNYLRAYIPNGAKLTSVTINNSQLNNNNIHLSVEHGYQVVGFLVSIPPQATSVVTIKYTLPFNTTTSGLYRLFVQKQSGTPSDPFTLEVISTHSLTPKTFTSSTTPNITFSQPMSTNLDLQFEIQP